MYVLYNLMNWRNIVKQNYNFISTDYKIPSTTLYVSYFFYQITFSRAYSTRYVCENEISAASFTCTATKVHLKYKVRPHTLPVLPPIVIIIALQALSDPLSILPQHVANSHFRSANHELNSFPISQLLCIFIRSLQLPTSIQLTATGANYPISSMN